MNERHIPAREIESPDDAAARWALRCADGLTPGEERELAAWVDADPAHAALLEEYGGAWSRFTPLAESAAKFAPERSSRQEAVPARSWWRLLAAPLLAAAAAVALVAWWRQPAAPAALVEMAVVAPRLPAPCQLQTLPDGTSVELNRGAELMVEYSDTERRVRLVRGEASFAVMKDPARPFIVVAGAVEARAVGTAFNVQSGPGGIEILVTEGIVRVDESGPAAALPTASLLLKANQQLNVAAGGTVAGATMTTLGNAQLQSRLAWQPRWLDFDDAPLAEIVAAFNRHNPVRLEIADPALAGERMTAKFRSDNVESFVRLLERFYRVETSAGANDVVRLSRH